MQNLQNRLRSYPRPYLTPLELQSLLDGTEDSRYGKVKRLLAQGKLQQIRRGLYCLTDTLHSGKAHPFELAQFIYGPSYISLESALAYHKLIPEAVYAITSACAKRSKKFTTPLGIFDYLHLPTKNFYTEVNLIRENDHQFFMAKPWKAICDYIYCYKKNWRGIEPLLESLRIQLEDLPLLSDAEADNLEEYYQHKRLSHFLKNILQELNKR